MPIHEIKNRWTGETMHAVEADTRDEAIKSVAEGGAVLSGAVLSGADLSGAVLSGATIPVVENLHTKILAEVENGGTLEMGDWHNCATTHCRARWTVHLAGEAGYALEKEVGPNVAGALISLASCPYLSKVPNFYATNEDALADIRACAAQEVGA